jgi:hypothetical protein
MRLSPNRLHYILRDVSGGERCQSLPKHLRMQARSEMTEQDGESISIAVGAYRGQQIIQFVRPRRRILAVAIRRMGVKPDCHQHSSPMSIVLAGADAVSFPDKPSRTAAIFAASRPRTVSGITFCRLTPWPPRQCRSAPNHPRLAKASGTRLNWINFERFGINS